VEAAIRGEPVDRPPVGAWSHAYLEEWSPEELAAVTVSRARALGWDFVKFQPRATCFAEAFGSEYRPSGRKNKAPELLRPAVPDLEAWERVPAADASAPSLADQVKAIGIVARELGPRVPVIQTVFSPITVGGYLVGKDLRRVVRELRREPALVLPALERVADALVDFSARSVEAGAAGIFYAVSGYATPDAMPAEVYENLVLPLDRHVLEALPAAAWFNVLHLCGSHLTFDLARRLPVQVVSWSIHNEGNPSLAEGRERSGRAVMGGVAQRRSMLRGGAEAVQREVREAIASTEGRALLVAPGCSVPPTARESNFKAMVEAAAA
jgi:uroporphyrinogen decarboxylase